MAPRPLGYLPIMEQRPEPPIGLEGLPAEEGVSTADTEERLEQHPEEQQNLSGEARRAQQESREQRALQIESDVPLAERRYPEDR